MKCPHCLIEINALFTENYIDKDSIGSFSTFQMIVQKSKVIEKYYEGKIISTINLSGIR